MPAKKSKPKYKGPSLFEESNMMDAIKQAFPLLQPARNPNGTVANQSSPATSANASPKPSAKPSPINSARGTPAVAEAEAVIPTASPKP